MKTDKESNTTKASMDDDTMLSPVIKVNHFEITCEIDQDSNDYNIYKEDENGENFEYLGSIKNLDEWKLFVEAIKLLNIHR